jgi:hypothetical protein
MANRNLNRPFCFQKMLTMLTGKVVLASGGAVTSNTGIGYTVAKGTTGQYNFTLDDQWSEVDGLLGNLVEPTVTTLLGKFTTAYSTVKTQKLGTLVFQITNNTAVAADVAAAAEIHFQMNLRNTSVPR